MASQEEWLRYSRGEYAAWIRRYLTGGRRVLKTDAFEEMRGDEVVRALGERFRELTMVDLAHSALVCGTGGRKVARVQTPVQRLPFADQSFDAVASLSTLDHFRSEAEIGESLRELARVTRGGGQLLVTLDNGGNPLVAVRNWLPNRWLARWGLAPYEYGRTLGPRAFLKTLEESGWQVDEYTGALHVPRAIAVAASRYCGPQRWLTPERFARLLRPFAAMERWPSRYRTGYFLLAVCRKKQLSPAHEVSSPRAELHETANV